MQGDRRERIDALENGRALCDALRFTRENSDAPASSLQSLAYWTQKSVSIEMRLTVKSPPFPARLPRPPSSKPSHP